MEQTLYGKVDNHKYINIRSVVNKYYLVNKNVLEMWEKSTYCVIKT